MNSLNSEKKKCAEELIKVEDEMNDAITRISELGIRKEEAISNQERLNRYFELALDSNINITRDEITLLLSKFGFTEEEQREAAKLLMFPEDGLFEYESFAFSVIFTKPLYDALPPFLAIDLDKILLFVCLPK